MKKPLKIIVCRGIPGSGKSTWAKQFVKENKNFLRVNRDDFRTMLDGYTMRNEVENVVSILEAQAIEQALIAGFDVVSDCTNLKSKYINGILTIAQRVGHVSVEEKVFPIHVEEAVRRDAARERPVGEAVVRKFHQAFTKMQSLEPVYFPSPNYRFEWSSAGRITDAIIVDLDGTLAIIGNRSPYDASRCDLVDTPCIQVVEVVKSLYQVGYKIVFVSGREDKDREATLRFIDRAFEGFKLEFELYMRKSGDQRPDNLVKREIYENHLKNKYNVMCAVDDRPKVIRAWKELGIFVFNVGDGKEF